MRKLIAALFTALAVMLSMFSFTAPAANAADSVVDQKASSFFSSLAEQMRENLCETTNESSDGVNYTYEVCAHADGFSSAKAIAKAKARTTADGRLVLSFIMPDGLPQSQQQSCKVIPAGTTYVNDYYDSTGHRHWIKKVAPAGGVKICFDGKVWRVVKCGNVVKWKPPAVKKTKVFKGRYKVVQRQKLWAKAVASATAKSTSTVAATLATGPCAGTSASAQATADAASKAVAKVWGWSKSKLDAKVEGTRGQLLVDLKNSLKGNASATAMAKAKTDVNAKIVCNVPEQPVTYDSPTVNVAPMACVAPGDTTTAQVTVFNPNANDDTVKLTFRGQTYTKLVAANSSVTFEFPGLAPGSYNGTALLVTANKSAPFTVNVAECVYPAPTFIQFREFNDLYVSLPGMPTTMDHCVTVDFPAGHSGEVVWTARFGSFTTVKKPAADGVQVCSAYTAPTEVPPGGKDTITVTATDSVTGKSVTQTTAPFTIKSWPTTP